jgi:hypothetical protein
MSRRHRHLNARDLGAKLVLDARYIDQSDNTAVSTWADRSGNGYDATQTNGTFQPTFQTAEFGGNGVVRFDGSNDFLNANGAAGVLRNVGGGTLFGVFKFNAFHTGVVLIFTSGTSTSATRLGIAVTALTNGEHQLGGRRLDADSFVTLRAQANSNNPRIMTGVADYANSDAFLFLESTQVVSNTNFQTAGNTSNTDSQSVQVGAVSAASQYLNGDIGQALAFNTALTASQRKRVEHAAAFSFKISCN